MRIAVSGLSMSYLSGQPLYCYELCRELRGVGHDVTMVSTWNGGLTGHDGYKLKENLLLCGVTCLDWSEPLPPQDLIIASEMASERVIDQQPQTPAIVVVHSEYECETPIPNKPQIIKYVCIRQSIMEHIIAEHGIPKDKCVVVYNGVDRKRFKPKKKTKRDFYKIVVPCTLDTLREPFLNKMIDEATEKRRVFLYGFDCGAKLHESPWVTVQPDKFDIEDEIADADEVAGILLGRVNLEAWSCGVTSSIYDPVTLESVLYEPPVDFDIHYNIETVAKEIISFVPDLNDLTLLIAHYDQRQKLHRLLDSIPYIKHVVVSKNGTFAESNNRGMLSVSTQYVLVLNDDTVIESLSLIIGMMNTLTTSDIVGVSMKNGCNGFDIQGGVLIEKKVGENGAVYPSGACLMMKTSTYRDLSGFCEEFKNGCEDVDFYLRAKDKGYTIKQYTGDSLFHDEASSTGRFDHLNENIELFNKKWKGVCQINAM